jgi:hypothetical protein
MLFFNDERTGRWFAYAQNRFCPGCCLNNLNAVVNWYYIYAYPWAVQGYSLTTEYKLLLCRGILTSPLSSVYDCREQPDDDDGLAGCLTLGWGNFAASKARNRLLYCGGVCPILVCICCTSEHCSRHSASYYDS